jgi:phosphatidylglycerol:prolipoprotein diacylglycerol transferase
VHPYLFDLGEIDLPLLGEIRVALPSYGVTVALSLVVAWVILFRIAQRESIPLEPASRAIFWTLLAGLLGGKLGLVIVDLSYYASDPTRLLSAELLTSAGVVWAALLAGLATLTGLSLRFGLPLGRLLDAAAVAVPVAQAIGRVGCLLAGCCYGSACRMPWAVVYHSHEARARTGVPLGQPLHPAPLYEAVWSLAVVLPAVLIARRYRLRAGEAALAYLVAYGSGRFIVELFRGDRMRGFWFDGALSTSQLVSILVVPVAAGCWVALRRRARGSGPS